MPNRNKTSLILWILEVILALALLFARVVFSEYLWVTAVVAIPLLVVSGLLIQQNRAAIKGRTFAYGANSLVTVLLILGIGVVINFLGARYPQKLDLTKNKRHTLSEQTIKTVKGLPSPVRATLFAKVQQREQNRMLLENYKSISPKFELEYVDPDRDIERTKAAGIRKYGTLQLAYAGKTSTIEEPAEEKITNALIKLLKTKSQTFCAITGHGERSFTDSSPEGYSGIKTALTNQSYDFKEVNLTQEGKIPSVCDTIAIIGPTKGYFKNEVQLVQDYLANGGHAIFAFDTNLRGPEYEPELIEMLHSWFIQTNPGLILNKRYPANLGPSASLLGQMSPNSPITQNFKVESIFPSARSIEIMPGAPVDIHLEKVAQTLPDSLLVTDMKSLASGQVKLGGSSQKSGPFAVLVTAEGKQKDSKAPRNTRLAVFGTSLFAINSLANAGGNLDFLANTAAWVLEDEDSISIRPKEESSGRLELTLQQSMFIMLLTVIVIPVLIAVSGMVVWVIRRRL